MYEMRAKGRALILRTILAIIGYQSWFIEGNNFVTLKELREKQHSS